MTNPDPNKHVLDYLKYYCDEGSDFDYAVLVSGPWGIGKTHLIKQFMNSRTAAVRSEKTTRTLFVSLYGITSVRQIEDEFQRQLHPILSSKGMKIGWTVAKGLIKATTKIDWGEKEELTVNAQLPDIDLTQYFQTPKDCLLVFDDLERCSMNVSDVLGYINSFVEHHEFKAIILANEGAIINKDKQYELIKEKLIGQTLEVRSSAPDALQHFLKQVRHQKTKAFLKRNTDVILLLHQQSSTDNLRLLKHALWDFERLSKNLAAKHWHNTDALTSLLRTVLALSFEKRSGNLKPDQFVELGANALTRRMATKGGADTSVAGRIETKYGEVMLEDTPISFQLLKALLIEGWVEPDELRSELDKSHYYADPALEPPWLTAWRGLEVNDDVFATAVCAIESQFKNRSFQSIGEMLHIFGLRLFFSEIGIVQFDKPQIVTQCLECLKDLAKQDKIEEFDTADVWRAGGVYCLGRGVFEAETSEFQTIYEAFEKTVTETKAAHLPARGKELLALLKTDAIGYSRKLMLNTISASEYYDVPILATIEPTEFVDTLLSLTPRDLSTAITTFRGRYERVSLDNELAGEQEWLKVVRTDIAARIPSLPPLSRFRLKSLVARNIDPFLKISAEADRIKPAAPAPAPPIAPPSPTT